MSPTSTKEAAEETKADAKVEKSIIAKRRGKKYAEKKALLDKKSYTLSEAMELFPQLSYSKFDGTAELHMKLNADPKHADQAIRSTIVLPHGTGKSKKIAAIVPDEKAKAAKDAGADIVGHEDLIEDIKKGNINFEIAVATPDVMKDLAKVAKILGQKGLMPNPKAGTVTPNIEESIKEIKKGKIEFRMDKNSIIHCPFGKVSFGAEKLTENIKALIKAIVDAKPSGIKGSFIKSIALTVTMGPAIPLDVTATLQEISGK